MGLLTVVQIFKSKHSFCLHDRLLCKWAFQLIYPACKSLCAQSRNFPRTFVLFLQHSIFFHKSQKRKVKLGSFFLPCTLSTDSRSNRRWALILHLWRRPFSRGIVSETQVSVSKSHCYMTLYLSNLDLLVQPGVYYIPSPFPCFRWITVILQHFHSRPLLFKILLVALLVQECLWGVFFFKNPTHIVTVIYIYYCTAATVLSNQNNNIEFKREI